MASNYDQIRRENIRKYGEETRHLAFLGRLYSDRTHFVYELLQNAEDKDATCIQISLYRDRHRLKSRHVQELHRFQLNCYMMGHHLTMPIFVASAVLEKGPSLRISPKSGNSGLASNQCMPTHRLRKFIAVTNTFVSNITSDLTG